VNVPQDVMERLAAVDTRPTALRRADFEESPHAGGSGEDTIYEFTANAPFGIRDQRYRVVPVARESFSTDGNSDQDTFTLSHDIIDSRVSDDLVLYEGDQQVSADSIDYANDTFDYTDNGTGNDLTAYYVVATQAAVKIRKVAPGDSNSETLVEHDAALINRRDPNKDPLVFDLNASQLQRTVPRDWKLQITIRGPFDAGRDPDTDPAPVNALVQIPINRADVAEVDGLAAAVNTDTARRT
jgi:hypothetical protein